MHGDSDKSSSNAAAAEPDKSTATSLTDVIDQVGRSAFQRALERRQAAAEYQHTIESANLVRHGSS